MDVPELPDHINCRCFGVVGAVANTEAVKAFWQQEVSMLMRRTADVDPELLRNAEIRALTNPS
jgi:hypothetical protein